MREFVSERNGFPIIFFMDKVARVNVKIWGMVLFLVMGFSVIGYSEETLLFTEALERAYENNVELQSLIEKQGVLDFQRRENWTRAYLPSLRYSYRTNQTKDEVDAGTTETESQTREISLSYTIYDGGRNFSKVRVIDLKKRKDSVRIEQKKREVKWDLIRKWLDYQSTKNRIQIHTLVTQKSLHDWEKNKKKHLQGLIGSFPLLQFQTNYASNRYNLQKEEHQLARQERALLNLLGFSPPLLPMKKIPFDFENFGINDLEFYKQSSLKNRTEFAVLEHEILELQEDLIQNESLQSPLISLTWSNSQVDIDTQNLLGIRTEKKEEESRLSIGLTYRWGGQKFGLDGSSTNTDSVDRTIASQGYGAHLEIFPGHGATDGAAATAGSTILNATLALEQKKSERSEREKLVIQEVEDAFHNLQDSLTLVELNQLIQKKEKEKLRLETRGYEIGTGKEEDLIIARDNLKQAEIDLNSSLIEIQKNWLYLNFISGLPL